MAVPKQLQVIVEFDGIETFISGQLGVVAAVFWHGKSPPDNFYRNC